MRQRTKNAFMAIILLALIFSGTGAAFASFSDVPLDNQNRLFIEYLSARGIVKGFPDGTYKPADALTRAEAAVMLVQAAGLAVKTSPTSFVDVDANHWAAGSIAAAQAAGLFQGYPDGTFRPSQPVTRAEGMTMVMGLSKEDMSGLILPVLADMDWDHWAARPVAVALDAGMVSLTSDGKFFRPGAPLSRGALARALATLITIDPELYQAEMSNQLKVLTGSVTVTRADGTVLEGRDLIKLHPGDVVVTGAGSSAQIDFIDGSGLKIDEYTEIKLKELVGRSYIKSDGDQGTAVEWLTFDLVKGKLFGALASTAQPQEETNKTAAQIVRPASFLDYIKSLLDKPAPGETDPNKNLQWWKVSKTKRVKVKVDMPWGVAAIRGTFWAIAVAEDGTSRTSVLKGDGEVTSGGQTVPVTDGQVTQVTEAAKPPAPPAPMAKEDKQEWVKEQQWAETRAQVITQQKEAAPPPPPPAEIEIPNPIIPQLGANTGEQTGDTTGDTTGQPTGDTSGGQTLVTPDVFELIRGAIEEAVQTIDETPTIEQTKEPVPEPQPQPEPEPEPESSSGGYYDNPPDTTPPVVSITSPTNQGTYTTASPLFSLGGTASDNAGVSVVTYTINGVSGNAVGTTSWSIAEVNLQIGLNVITVTAIDSSGNHTSTSITVTLQSLTGLITGEIREAGGSWPVLAGVTISLFNGAEFNSLYASTVTDDVGAFSMAAAPGPYKFAMSKENYLTAVGLATVIEGDNHVKGHLIPQSTTASGDVQVTVQDAFTGQPVSGLTLNFRLGLGVETGEVAATGSTDIYGVASVTLPVGYFTVEMVGDSLAHADFRDVAVVGGQTISWLFDVVPYVSPDLTKIVLTWAGSPADLNSHLYGPTSGGQNFHVFYVNPSYLENELPVVELDVDETSGGGPETVTIRQQAAGTYKYMVQVYANGGTANSLALAGSGAQVKIYRGSSLAAAFDVPLNQAGTLWNVFELNGETITPVNTISSLNPPMLETGIFETYGDPYHTVGETIELMLYDADLKVDPSVIETITVNVHSTVTDSMGINVTLTEQWENAGAFIGSFTIIGPAESAGTNKVKAAAGEEIIITYIDDLDALGQSGTVVTASFIVTDVAQSVSFTDADIDLGQIGGALTIEPAASEAALTHYEAYFLDDYGYLISGPLAVIPQGGPYSVDIPADTMIPPGAGQIGVFSVDGTTGYMTKTAALIMLVDDVFAVAASTTGIVATMGEPYHTIGETLQVIVVDADMNTDPTITETLQVKVASATNTAGVMLTLTEAGLDTDQFVGGIIIVDPAYTGTTEAIKAGVGEDIMITYIDALNADGVENTAVNTYITVTDLAQTGSVGDTGVISILGEPYFAVGETVSIVVTDLDLGLVPDMVEQVQVQVFSATDQTGITVMLTENSVNSDSFTGGFTIVAPSDPGGPGKIRAAAGEEIMVVYMDFLDEQGLVNQERYMIITVTAAQTV